MTNQIRDSFIFYRSFYQSAKKLPKEDKAELFDAICSYALDGESMDLSVVPEAIFTVIQPNLDANRKRWQNGCKPKKEIKDINLEISKPEAKRKQNGSKTEGNKDKDKDKDVNKDVELKLESKLEIPDFIEANLWNDFVTMRKEAKKPLTETIIKGCISKLTKFENKKEGNANQALENSIAGGWQGLFEPAPDNNNSRIKF